MVDNEKNEDLDICRQCGGMCCIKCGCDYSTSDFKELTYKSLLESLSVGDKSIVAALDFKFIKSGKIVAQPFLYIRARNNNRDIIDLISMKTRCSQLDENGCKYDYEHRPFGGRNLTPSRTSDGPCRPMVSPIEIINKWMPYQNQLRRIVKQYTGMSVEKKLRQDAENLFYDVMMRNFEGISPLELLELEEFVPMLALAYPDEYKSVNMKIKNNGNKLVMNKNNN